jgi:hypothetical protein
MSVASGLRCYTLARHRTGEVRYLPWGGIARITNQAVELTTRRADLQPLEQRARYR